MTPFDLRRRGLVALADVPPSELDELLPEDMEEFACDREMERRRERAEDARDDDRRSHEDR
jgi:hypothetical protein